MQEVSNQYHAETGVYKTNVAACQPWFRQIGASHRKGAIRVGAATIFIVDDDAAVRETMRDLLEDQGYTVECFADGPEFLRAYKPGRHGCLLVDALMPGMSGTALLEQSSHGGIDVPAIMMSGSPSLHMAVQAMKFGAVDFIEKPISSELLLSIVKIALEQSEVAETLSDFCTIAAQRVNSLTKRQREILDLVVAGHPSKNIAADLHISQRTVENHRAAIARKTGSRSLPALIQTALCANLSVVAQREPRPVKVSPSSPRDRADMLD